MAAETKKVKCKLKKNREYGRSRRRGKSMKIYEFSFTSETEVLTEDLPGLQDAKNPQYEKYLQVVK